MFRFSAVKTNIQVLSFIYIKLGNKYNRQIHAINEDTKGKLTPLVT